MPVVDTTIIIIISGRKTFHTPLSEGFLFYFSSAYFLQRSFWFFFFNFFSSSLKLSVYSDYSVNLFIYLFFLSERICQVILSSNCDYVLLRYIFVWSDKNSFKTNITHEKLVKNYVEKCSWMHVKRDCVVITYYSGKKRKIELIMQYR